MTQNFFAKSKFLREEMQTQFSLFKETLHFISSSPFIRNYEFNNLKNFVDNDYSTLIYNTHGGVNYYSERFQQSLYLISNFQFKIKNEKSNALVHEIQFRIHINSDKKPEYKIGIERIIFSNGDTLSINKTSEQPEHWENSWHSVKTHFKFQTKRIKNKIFFYDEHLFFPFDNIYNHEMIQEKSKNYFPNDVFNRMRFLMFKTQSPKKPIGYVFYKGYLKKIIWVHEKIKPTPLNIEKPSVIQINKKNKIEAIFFRHYKNYDVFYYKSRLMNFYQENDISPKKNFSISNDEKLLLEMNNILNL